MKKALLMWSAAFLLAVPSVMADKTDASQKYTAPNPYDVAAIKPATADVPVKNVIFMIGDGMGMEHLFAAWSANRGKLNIENCPVTGISKTYCANSLVTDSAASGTAMATGQKTLYGAIGVGPDGKPLDSLAVKAADLGKSTGLVVTSELNDATPSAFYAHNKQRSNAHDIIGDMTKSRVDFYFGGGAKNFTNRPDKRDIFDEMEKKGYKVSRSWEELSTQVEGKVLAVVSDGNLPVPEERADVLEKASMKAINLLSKNKKGFFLMIEGSKIDKEAHKNNLPEMIQEIFDFDRTVGKVLDWASEHPGTLVVVTADHNTGGFSMIGGDKGKGEIVGKYSTGNHNGTAVPVYAFGAGSGRFTGVYENTALFDKINALMSEGKK